MTSPSSSRPLPPGLLVFGSVAVFLHLSAFGLYALAQRSGPWPMGEMNSPAEPPYFSIGLAQWMSETYLEPLRMTHTYHFPDNIVSKPGVVMEVRLKDASGKVMKTLQFPDKDALPWVRHRQDLLAQWLGEDQPVIPRQGETVAAPNQKIRTYKIWEGPGPKEPMRLKEIEEHLIPRDRPVMSPSDFSLLVAQSYMRYLCREHGADSAELIRRSKDAVSPVSLLAPQPVGNFDELVCIFGEYSAK